MIGAREYDGGSPESYIFKAQIDIIDHNALARTNIGRRSPLYIDLALDSPPYGRVTISPYSYQVYEVITRQRSQSTISEFRINSARESMS